MKIEIDFAFAVGSKLLICGWVAVDGDISEHQLIFGDAASDAFLFERPDVSKVMLCPQTHCIGFLVCLGFQNDGEIKIAWEGEEVTINSSSLVYAKQLVNIETIPQVRFPDVTTMLERNGFYWGQKALSLSSDVGNTVSITDHNSKIQVDYVYTLNSNTLLVIGWVLDISNLFKRINLRVNNTISNNIIYDAFFHPRYDVSDVLKIPHTEGENIGFAFTVSLPDDINSNIELIYSKDDAFFTGVPLIAEPFNREETWLTEILLANVDITNSASDPKLYKHVTPAIEKSWHSRLVAPNSATVTQFGSAVVNPKLSLIIPIYGRYDFVQIQMSQFSIDAQIADIEIVYVLDDPRIKHPFMVTCHGVYETFGVPFKTVVSQRNLGYAGANNLGVDHANAEHIILMNSDVIPKQPGHFFKMLEQFKASKDIGILGGTLLYEDNTIQHQGMEYMQDPSHPGMWMNYHPQKGFPLSLTDEFDIRDAQAVTGALMLMTKQQYIDVGGFDIGYILGDFEDSDLCMKVRNQNKRIAVSGVVQMYHLERLSQSLVSGNTWKHTLSMLNGLRHTNKWNDRIVEVMAENG